MTQLCVQMVEKLARLEERVLQLEYLWSEEIMRQGAGTPPGREVIAELGHGWRIERAPACEPGAGGVPGRAADGRAEQDGQDLQDDPAGSEFVRQGEQR